MTIKAGYWVDLSGIQFHDELPETWIQAMTVGTYEHPFFGEIKITRDRIKNFADNVNNGVRTQDLNIDYDHNGGEAAGWVKSAEARPNGLYLLVEWTKTAADKIKSKAYRYFSPEFADEWTHPKTQKVHKDVLFGGGITNRPFLKDILPINMSEFFEVTHSEDPPEAKEGKGMDPKELRKLLGLPEAASDEQVTAKLNELQKPKELTPEETAEIVKKAKEEEEAKALAEKNAGLPDDLKKLAESNPAIKKLTDMFEAQAGIIASQTKTLAETQVALKMSEIDSSVKKLSDAVKVKGFAFPPATLDEIRKLLTEAPTKAFADQVYTTFEKMGTVGLVELKERGSTRGGTHVDGDPVKQFSEEITKVMKDNDKLDYADAVARVSAEQPELFEEYRQASFSGRE